MVESPALSPVVLPESLFRGLSIYQDVVMAGHIARRGERDCAARWQAIKPHLVGAGTVLDIGSNFGWFGLQICQANPHAVVASVEADLRSAAVQRAVLSSHADVESSRQASLTPFPIGNRICLLTARAGLPLAARFASADTRFDAALCLNVLHWVRDHREFLHRLGDIADRIIIEHPDPNEVGAGVDSIRCQIGPIGPYLRHLFDDRPVERIAFTESHRDQSRPRELWLVGPRYDGPLRPQSGIDAAALLQLAPAWPPRAWWLQSLAGSSALAAGDASSRCLDFTASGLRAATGKAIPPPSVDLYRLARRVPETGVATRWQRWQRGSRQFVGNLLRRCGLRR